MNKEEVRKEIRNYLLLGLCKFFKWFGGIASIVIWTISITKWHTLDFLIWLVSGFIMFVICVFSRGFEEELSN